MPARSRATRSSSTSTSSSTTPPSRTARSTDRAAPPGALYVAAYSASVASPGTGNALGAQKVRAIWLDAGGVLVFPEPGHLLPPLRTAGLDPGPAVLQRAHYQAMAAQDQEAMPPAPGTWWRDYLT